MQAEAKELHFEYVNVDRQTNFSDCGVYALAFAAELAHGGDSAHYFWDEEGMRNHIIRCLEESYVSPFPKKGKRRLGLGKRMPVSFTERIYCVCRMPDDGSEYIVQQLSFVVSFPLCPIRS